MSIHYRSIKTIQMTDLFDGRLERFHIVENQSATALLHWRRLTDGSNNLSVESEAGTVEYFGSYDVGEDPRFILNCIEEVFDTKIVSHYEPQYWGCESEEELEALEATGIVVDIDEIDGFYRELRKFVAGRPCRIVPGTTDMKWAEIAKSLVALNPALGLIENRDTLLSQIYEQTQRVVAIDETRLNPMPGTWEGGEAHTLTINSVPTFDEPSDEEP